MLGHDNFLFQKLYSEILKLSYLGETFFHW